MNVLKNFEAAFIVTLGLVFAADYALDVPAQDPVTTQASAQPMQVVVVSAKRLTDEQKKQMLIDDNQTTLAADATTSSKI
ncbi:hypothetical protein JOD97_002658 [Duganella sp. 1411]|jgi:hypothetical protein|uniref:hypothetical protein n=1 Tax=Duganella sp. 1411 TaxID=2806572 RepID=UPI001AE7C3C9|nr:hypothetical protein [Duganella sp. 1411]MBP1204616.1 hypothetical protein [Duganella sp. 1411]